ncbi:TPM domain-containing protein [Skermania sp. ID1734]|uniref:TPM domain-containing protein n=1 Tax=Skermania sp. ID1734 TaxID=2597516 RepID=UPI0011814462|nr:TPM domain-containing protein [Skermania sp. ID1734]TSE00076.1 TPM domain-containing protein [Skermania sp. ID1734]
MPSSVWPRLAGLLLLLGALTLASPTIGRADPPQRLPTQVTDEVAALDAAGRAQVQRAIDALYTDHKVRLWVVYVADFAGQGPQDWAAQTVAMSGLGDRDVLLAVAIKDRAYYFDVPSGLANVGSGDIDDITINAIEPALHQGDWAGAAVATAAGLSTAMAGNGFPIGPVAIGGAVVVVGAGGVMLYRRKRNRDRARADLDRARHVDPRDADALAALALPALDQRAKDMLVQMDNAAHSTAEELDIARSEFGDAAVQPFVTAFEQAKSTLARAFAIRQRLDDAVPETAEERRHMLVELITTCATAGDELSAKVKEFDDMRDLLIDAPQRLDALTQRVVEITTRIPESEATLMRLSGEFPAPALAPVHDNVRIARERLALAEQAMASARESIALPPGRQGPAVDAIRSAESALSQCVSLLDAVDHAGENIRHAIAALPSALDDARRDIAAATTLSAYGGGPLALARASAEQAIARAEAAKDTDPLGSFTALAAADVELDKALAAAGTAQRDAQRLQQQIDQALSTANAQIAAASDYIATRRGAVNAQARTRLAEAQRQLTQAQQVRNADRSAALSHAQSAAQLASRALMVAQADVAQWQSRAPSSSSGSDAGAVLGGILLDSFLRGSMRGRGGYGGYRGGSSGGSSSSGRMGRGGRF